MHAYHGAFPLIQVELPFAYTATTIRPLSSSLAGPRVVSRMSSLRPSSVSPLAAERESGGVREPCGDDNDLDMRQCQRELSSLLLGLLPGSISCARLCVYVEIAESFMSMVCGGVNLESSQISWHCRESLRHLLYDFVFNFRLSPRSRKTLKSSQISWFCLESHRHLRDNIGCKFRLATEITQDMVHLAVATKAQRHPWRLLQASLGPSVRGRGT